MRSLAILFSFLVAQHTVVSAAQQTPVRDPRSAVPAANAAPTGTGVIAGAVTAEDGRPIRFAYVLLLGATTGIVKVTSSDADGKFTFNSLPADRYTVGVSKAPFLGTLAGAKRPGRPGTPIVVANGQKISDVTIRMQTGGAITGVLTDERGQPGSGAMVFVMQARMENGERKLVQAGGQYVTDDEGRYRAHGLVPGDYVVVAMRPGSPLATRALTTGEVDAALAGGNVASAAAPPSTLRYAPVYFPGTTRGSDAVPISIGAGEVRSNADFRLETVQTARIEGILTTVDGQPTGGVALIMTSVPGSVLSTAMSVRVMPDGRFVAPNVQPGTQILMVNGTGAFAGQYARTVVEVSGTDVYGVQLTMRPRLAFDGRLAFEGATPPGVTGRRIPIRSLGSGAAAAVPQVGLTNQTGVFTVTNVIPGRYVLGGPLAFGPNTDTMTWTLQSVVVDGRNLTDLPIEIGDAPPTEVVVTYTDKWQELSGRLQSQSGAPVSDYSIIVFPEDKAYWFQGTRRIVTARPGTDGRFTLSGKGLTTLPPGKYLLAAVTDIGRDEQFDPAFLAQIVPAAIPITLGPGEKKVQDVGIK